MALPRQSGSLIERRAVSSAKPSSARSGSRGLLGRVVAWLALIVLVVALTPAAFAQDVSQLKKDVLTASDFRVRVTAALALGKKKELSAVGALSQALKDDNGAVRAAAAAALGLIGDTSAMSAIERARDSEKDANVKSSMEKALSTLKGQRKTKVIVSVSRTENKSGEPKVSSLFTSAIKSEIGRIPGVEVAPSEKDAVEQAKQRNLPTLALDAKLTSLSKSTSGADTAIAANVELLIRKIPEQSLKATVKGNAKALMNSKALKNDADVAALREDAVKAAVQSAIKGAPTAIDAATK